MKIIISKGDFAGLITAAGHFIGTIPAYTNLVFCVQAKMVLVSAFNGSMGLKAVVPAQVELAEGEEVKPFGVSANMLKDLVATLDGDITLSLEEGKLVVKAGKSKSRLSLASDVDDLKIGKWPELCSMPGSVVQQLLPLADFTAADTDANPVLTGILVKVAEDGLLAYGASQGRSCVAKGKITFKQAGSVLMPASFLKTVGKIVTPDDTVTFYSNGDRILFGIKHKAGRRALMAASPALAGKFPLEALEGFFGVSPSQEITVKVVDLLGALARIRAVEAGVARLYSNKKSSVLQSHQKDDDNAIGQSRTDFSFAWEGLDIFLPCKALAAAVSAIGGEEIRMAFTGNKGAVYGWNDSYRFILMPMAKEAAPVREESQVEEVLA